MKEEQKILNVAAKSRLSLVAYTGALRSLAFGILKDTLFKGKTEEEAKKECELAVRESIQHSPSKLRHKPYAFIVGHNDWWSINKNWKEFFDN
mgnify:CR=1 FL=1